MKAVAAVVMLCFSACSGTGSLRVVGPGKVRGEGLVCADSCVINQTIDLVAVPDEGAAFLGWEGDCAGFGVCRLQPGKAVTARFGEQSRLIVKVVGPGVIISSAGWECRDQCTHPAGALVRLSPVPSANAEFVGFSGACVGAICEVASGEVVATFVALSAVQVKFLGSGSGVVWYAGQACTADCEIETQTAASRVLTATADDSSKLVQVDGDCRSVPCAVAPPAQVRVTFQRMRRLTVNVSGSAPGAIYLDGAVFCAAGTCSGLIPADTPLVLAPIPGLSSRLARFEGDCTGLTCVIPAGISDLSVGAVFESLVLWHRSFDTQGHALRADGTGVLLAMVVPTGDITIDGYRFTTGPNVDTRMAVISEFDWDGGSKWVVALNQHQPIDGLQNPSFNSILRTSGTEVVVSGACSSGGRLNGMVQCNPYSTPLVLLLSDAGVQRAWTDLSYGSTFSSSSRIQNLVSFGGGVAAFREVGSAGVEEGSLGWVDSSVDAGFRAVSTNQELGVDVGSRDRCVPFEGRLRCLFYNRPGISLGDCQLPTAVVPNQGALLEFDENLQCRSARRVFASGFDIEMSGRTNRATSYFAGCGGSAGSLGGFPVNPLSCWIAERDASDFVRLAQSPRSTSYIDTWQVIALDEGVMVVSSIAAPFSAWGYVESDPDTSAILITVLADDLTTVTRRLVLTSPEPLAPTITASLLSRVGDTFAFFVTGRRISLNGQPLHTNTNQQTHLLVFKL